MERIKCENEFCLYFDNGECIVSEITLDARGCCQDCVFLDVSRVVLEKERDALLERYRLDEQGWK